MRWALGGLLVIAGALAGAFGTVAWLTVLCAPSLPRMLLGMLTLGVMPVLGGGALLWAGLDIVETQSVRARVWAFSDDHVMDATRGGATAPTIAQRLGITDLGAVTARLDDMVARDVLALDLTDDGELFYEPRPAA